MTMRRYAHTFLVAALGSWLLQPGAVQAQGAKVKYVKLKTTLYTLELPEGWQAGAETPFGQREIKPAPAEQTENRTEQKKEATGNLAEQASSGMTAMVAQDRNNASWDQLYKTSLYFITRYDHDAGIRATPYRLGRTRQGLASCSWSMIDAGGHPRARYTILKSGKGAILALSVKVPDPQSLKLMDNYFRHVVDTATFN